MKKQKKLQEIKNPERPKPIMEWQTGEYDKFAEYKLSLPYQFLLLCRLLEVTPKQVLLHFMDSVNCGSWKWNENRAASAKAIEYIIECGYGKLQYSAEEIRCMFEEMNSISRLWPENSAENFRELHVKWRAEYYNYWFKKWFNKPKRKL